MSGPDLLGAPPAGIGRRTVLRPAEAEHASRVLRAALDDIGLAETEFTVEIIDPDEAAQARHFAGSPAFVANGIDVFGGQGAPGAMACRVYPTPDGPGNLPTLSDLRRALKRCAATG